MGCVVWEVFVQSVLNSQMQILAWGVALQRSTKTQQLTLTVCCCNQQTKPAYLQGLSVAALKASCPKGQLFSLVETSSQSFYCEMKILPLDSSFQLLHWCSRLKIAPVALVLFWSNFKNNPNKFLNKKVILSSQKLLHRAVNEVYLYLVNWVGIPVMKVF